MSCVVGIVENGNVYIGGDSLASTPNFVFETNVNKVFRNGPFLFGCTGSFRYMNLLMHALEVPKQGPNESDMKYLTITFIDALRECLLNGGVMKREGSEDHGPCSLLGYRGHLYLIDDDFQVNEITSGYHSIGCGMNLAMGALYAIYNTNLADMSASDKIMMALRAASKYDPFVGGKLDVEILSPDNDWEEESDTVIYRETIAGRTFETVGHVYNGKTPDSNSGSVDGTGDYTAIVGYLVKNRGVVCERSITNKGLSIPPYYYDGILCIDAETPSGTPLTISLHKICPTEEKAREALIELEGILKRRTPLSTSDTSGPERDDIVRSIIGGSCVNYTMKFI